MMSLDRFYHFSLDFQLVYNFSKDMININISKLVIFYLHFYFSDETTNKSNTLFVPACCCLTIPTVSHVKGKNNLVLMHNSVLNEHQLLCDAHTVPKLHRGTAALFLYNSQSSLSTFFFVTLAVLFLFLGASIVSV